MECDLYLKRVEDMDGLVVIAYRFWIDIAGLEYNKSRKIRSDLGICIA